MSIEIGAKIKSLRLAGSMTQEQLAQKLGVTAQAVSKWESGTNMPDIQLLPDLSVIFGVSIDELFAMTDENRLKRIDNMLYSVRFLSEEEFRQAERYLKECQRKQPLADEAGLLLAQLYNKRAREYHELAKPLAREALQRIPGRKEAHNAIFDAENGAYQDWNMINHRELIDFYKDVTHRHPEDIRNYFWLLDLLIADCRTEEARHYAEAMKQVEYSYHYEMYMGYICRAECNLPAALDWWQKMTEHSPERWVVWAEYGSIMAKLGRYDEAVLSYKKAMPMRPRPRFTDCEDAVAQICLIQGDVNGAIEMQMRMLGIVREDWNGEGEEVDRIWREVHRLEALRGPGGEDPVLEALLQKARDILDDAPCGPGSQALVLQTKQGRILSVFVPDAMRVTRPEEEQQLLSQLCREDEVIALVCLWAQGDVDLPRYEFREDLCRLNPQNENARMVLITTGGYGTKTIARTMR